MIAGGLLGGGGYLVDKKVDEWNRETWGPLREKIDRFKLATKPFRDIPREIGDIFKLPDLEDQFQKSKTFDRNNSGSIEDEIKSTVEALDETFKGDESEDPAPPVLGAVPLGAAIYSQRDEEYEDEESKKLSELRAELTMEFEAQRTKLLNDIESLLDQIEKLKSEISTLEDLNAELEVRSASDQRQGADLLAKYEGLQREVISAEMRHQKHIERLEQENDDLHTRLAKSKTRLGSDQVVGPTGVSLVELYSSALDSLEESKEFLSYVEKPELPRVVVVGDQSSGKTSVLELVAKARIFPRGAGQMMTRAPIKVTISEGRRHCATFPGSNEEFQLDNESDLARLRAEVERQMLAACEGKTISSETIKINVRGPGLKRMILVDLPGLIATETAGIAPGTREDIATLAREEMSHPKAIILCVQDGSVDAERSQVTDFVRRADPTGERSVLVLTKVDKAICDPVRLKQILDGKLFPLRAIGYFAVVAGMENRDATIAQIRAHESAVFQNSELFSTGLLKPEQLGASNMCDTVSRAFWALVRSSLKGELAKLSDHLFALETEWKNNYRNVRELDRAQLFEKGKEDILDRLVRINVLDEGHFEDELKCHIWSKIESHLVKEIYLPAEQNASSASEFNTLADIRLRHFTNTLLPSLSLEAAGDLLLSHFDRIISSPSPIYKSLFDHVKSRSRETFHAEMEKVSATVLDELRVLQQATVSNRFIQSPTEWQMASDQLEGALKRDLERCRAKRSETCGPLWYQQWYNWTSRTEEQFKNDRTKRVLDKLPLSTGSRLSKEEVTRARYEVDKNYQLKVTAEEVDDVWRDVYAVRWIKSLNSRAKDCKHCFQKYKASKLTEKRSPLLCEDVVLWWRTNKAIEITAANLRQRMLNENGTEYLKRGIENALLATENDTSLIKDLINGRQVELAEEMKFIKNITSLLKTLNDRLQTESIG